MCHLSCFQVPSKMALEQLKKMTVVVADTGDFESEFVLNFRILFKFCFPFQDHHASLYN